MAQGRVESATASPTIPNSEFPPMLRIRSLYLAAVVLVSTATLGAAQIPGSFLAAPGSVTLAAAKGESFALTLSSTVQASALTIADSTAGASQAFSGSVVLTPDWDLTNNRVVTVYAYVSTPFTSASSSLAWGNTSTNSSPPHREIRSSGRKVAFMTAANERNARSPA